MLAEIEVENKLKDRRPPGLELETISRICRIRRVSRVTREEIVPQGGYSKQELMTYEAIGEKLGITAQRVQQICERALRKLRKMRPRDCRALLELSDERHRCLPQSETKPVMEMKL